MLNKFPFILFLLIPITTITNGQDITTEGKDFWFGFMENHEDREISLEIYISATDSTKGTVEIPLLGWSESFEVPANSTVMVKAPTDSAMANGSGVLERNGIHLQAENNISVYALNSRRVSADATVVLPTPALGREYYVMSHSEPAQGNPSKYAEFLIVASEDDTNIDITPSVNTRDKRAARTTYSITLNQGETYQVQAESDLTGTRIKASGQCKPFALFGGNEWTRIGGCGGAQDHLFEQMYPIGTWGKNYAIVPYKDRLGGDLVKVLAASNNTLVQISETSQITLNQGQYINLTVVSPRMITADKPIMVAQFSRSKSCDDQDGDPFMIILSPVEQALTNITYNAPNVSQIEVFYTNIITPTATVDQLLFDGDSIKNNFNVIPGNEQYSYAQLRNIGIGNHTISSEGGFTAYVYGFGNIESFGYATGASLDNLNLIITAFEDNNTNQETTSVCSEDELVLTVSSKRSFAEFEWKFSNGQILYGDTVSYKFDQPGKNFITITGVTTGGSCSDSEIAIKAIEVIKPNYPVLGTSSVCPFNENVPYSVNADTSNIYQWFVEGGIINTTNAKDSISINWGNTNDAANVQLLSTTSKGCVGDTVILPIKVNIQLDPTTPIGLDSICASNITSLDYFVYPNPTSTYTWNIDHGIILSEQGKNEVNLSWDGYGFGQLSYTETSLLDDICTGKSDTLTVFIEREPNESLDIILPKYKLQIGDSIPFQFNGDSLFNYISWDFGNEYHYDSLIKTTNINYAYPCNGIYDINISAFTGTLCPNLGLGKTQVEVVAPKLEINFVSHDLKEDNALEINYSVKNIDFYTQKILLNKSKIDPDITNWKTISNIKEDGLIIDQDIESSTSIYEYQLMTNTHCDELITSLPHNNIRLIVNKDSATSVLSIQLDRNEYNTWPDGVLKYELWRTIDGSELVYVTDMNRGILNQQYNEDGFDYCYRVKAIELNGSSVSWSNASCVSFVPEIHTYNIITPNGDGLNDYFVVDKIEYYKNNKLTIINRHGKRVFQKNGYNNEWKGEGILGNTLASGVYYYVLNLNEPRSKKGLINGTVTLLR